MFREGLRPPDPFQERHPFEELRTQDGVSLLAMSKLGPVLVLCLPADPRRMIAALRRERAAIEAEGARIVLVHADPDAVAVLEAHDMQYLARIADRERRLYGALGLGDAPRGLLARLTRTHAGPAPGAFLVRDGEVLASATGADIDYVALLSKRA